jgi:peptide chain release factor
MERLRKALARREMTVKKRTATQVPRREREKRLLDKKGLAEKKKRRTIPDHER